MRRHDDGSVTYTAQEERCISVAFRDLLTYSEEVTADDSLEGFIGWMASVNIARAEHILEEWNWPGVKQYITERYGEGFIERRFPELLMVNDEIAERMLTGDEDEEYPPDEEQEDRTG